MPLLAEGLAWPEIKKRRSRYLVIKEPGPSDHFYIYICIYIYIYLYTYIHIMDFGPLFCTNAVSGPSGFALRQERTKLLLKGFEVNLPKDCFCTLGVLFVGALLIRGP